MNLTEISQKMDDLPNKDKKAILALIDLKTENEMDKVLARFDSLDTKIDNIEKRLESKMDIQFKMLLWALGILLTVMTVFKFV